MDFIDFTKFLRQLSIPHSREEVDQLKLWMAENGLTAFDNSGDISTSKLNIRVGEFKNELKQYADKTMSSNHDHLIQHNIIDGF